MSRSRPVAATATAPPAAAPAARAPETAPAVIAAAPEPVAPQATAIPASPIPVAPAYQPRSDRIAIVLPLQSSLYGRAAEAVRAGFLAAATTAGSAARVQVIGHADDGVLPAVAAATEAGVALIVGPLTRDDLKTVLAMAPLRPRMLALNQPEDGTPLPADTYAVALTIESDAALLARRAYDEGARSLATVTSDAPLQQRFSNAFTAEWERSGGRALKQYRFDANPEVLALLRRELAVRTPDAVLLALAGEDAALVKPYLPQKPVYASSQIADGLQPSMLRDLEGVRYVEIPWLADPSAAAFARLPRPDSSDPVLERLYALGLDAFALGDLLANAVPPQRVEFEGATGHLSLTLSRNFAREGRLMIIHDGQSVAYTSPQ
ncbi:MAG TPA: penicillin-binding protein activator [Casimicrobiaceae bacterium]|nr:penicillin-binding protein activator [Casimicrobiaceae bacterium]